MPFNDLRVFSAYLMAVVLTSTSTACASEWRSNPIYPGLKWRTVATKQKPGKPCDTVPAPVTDIATVSKYGEKNATNSSVVDEDSEQQYLADTAPIVSFTSEISSRTDHFIEGRSTGDHDARCALDWLDGWARGGAFLGSVNRQGEAVRKWELGTLATSYIKLSEAPSLDPEKMERIRNWIHAIALAVKADYSRDLQKSSRNNNHMNWASWGVTAAGIATNDRDLFDWGLQGYAKALDQIQDNGSLPLELERRTRAASYHMFALQPLIMIAEAAEANGIPAYAMKGGRLQKLIDLNLAAVADPQVIGKMNGFAQDPKYSESSLSWVEPYYARTGDARVLPIIEKYRPFGSRRTGGDMTALFFHQQPPARK